MSQLHWFPFYVQDWEKLTRGLSLEDEGALIRLCRRAWLDTEPGSFPDNPDELARVLGARWKRFMALVDYHFPRDGKGRRRCSWLQAMYAEQRAKFERRSTQPVAPHDPPRRPTERRGGNYQRDSQRNNQW